MDNQHVIDYNARRLNAIRDGSDIRERNRLHHSIATDVVHQTTGYGSCHPLDVANALDEVIKMAREPGIDAPDAIWHVSQYRGVQYEALFNAWDARIGALHY